MCRCQGAMKASITQYDLELKTIRLRQNNNIGLERIDLYKKKNCARFLYVYVYATKFTFPRFYIQRQRAKGVILNKYYTFLLVKYLVLLKSNVL